MRNLMRFLMMFGPMIYRGVTKMMNQRQQQQNMQRRNPAPEQNRNQDQSYDEFEEVEDPIQRDAPPSYKEDDFV